MKELAEYPWPELRDVDVAFPTMETPMQLEVLSRLKPYEAGHKAFNTAFFSGGKLVYSHEFVDWEKKAFQWMLAYMRGFASKHEHKTSICAMIFEELGVSVVKG